MGKRLTPEEREARIKAYEEAKAARKAERLEKRKARVEAYEKHKELRKRGIKPAEVLDSTKTGQVKKFPTYKGNIEVGDEVGFRWIGLAMAGKVLKIEKEQNYRVQDEDNPEETEEKVGGLQTYCTVKENSEGIVYPIKRNDILAKKVNGRWIDSCK